MLRSAFQSFRWSERELTLAELVAEYTQCMPFPILITEGYMATNDDRMSSSTNEVFWLHDVIRQTGIIVKDTERRRYRIPHCYEAMVVPVNADGSEDAAFPVSEVLLRNNFKLLRFVDPVQQVAPEVEAKGRPNRVAEFRLVGRYDEDLLVVHPILVDELLNVGYCVPRVRNLPQGLVHPKFILLPSSLPIKVSIAVAMDSSPDATFFYVMADMKMVVDAYPHDYPDYLRNNAAILPDSGQGARKRRSSKRDSRMKAEFRPEPVALSKELDLSARLSDLRQFYDGRFNAARLVDKRNRMSLVEAARQRATANLERASAGIGRPGAGSRLRPVSVDVASRGPDTDRLFPTPREGASSGRAIVDPERPRHRQDGARPPPERTEEFGVDDVTEALGILGLSDCAPRMRAERVDGEKVTQLREKGLRGRFGLTAAEAGRLMEFVRSRMEKPAAPLPETVRRKLPEGSYVTLYQ